MTVTQPQGRDPFPRQHVREPSIGAFARPAEYGLGKSGWVVFEPSADQMPPMRQLKSWLDESYRAQAPKKLVAQIPQNLLAQIREE